MRHRRRRPVSVSGVFWAAVGGGASDSYPSVTRTTFANKIFRGRLEGKKARLAVRGVIKDHADLRHDLEAAGYQAFARVRYSAEQHRILSEYFAKHPGLVDEYAAKYCNVS